MNELMIKMNVLLFLGFSPALGDSIFTMVHSGGGIKFPLYGTR